MDRESERLTDPTGPPMADYGCRGFVHFEQFHQPLHRLPQDENAGMLRIASGVVLVLAGTIWILQGLNVAFAPQSFMTGDKSWSWVGVAAVVSGVGLVWWGVRSQRSSK